MAIAYASIRVELREVSLANKPSAMLAISPKATVPVLQFEDRVIDESLEIIDWALQQSDPHKWMRAEFREDAQQLIAENDTEFKLWLDKYKYWDRYPQYSQHYYRAQAEQFIGRIENLLTQNKFLLSGQITVADIAILPFIRQFAFVDKAWFDRAPYPNLQRWLEYLLASSLFVQVMHKLLPWQQGDPSVFFPADM